MHMTTPAQATVTATGQALAIDAGCPWSGADNADGLSLACPFPCDCTAATQEPVATVEITRLSYILPSVADLLGLDAPEWECAGEGDTDSETWDADWDAPDYGNPIVWAAARIRDLSCDHNLEPSIYPLLSSVPSGAWLSASYENPYVTERIETTARVTGVSDMDRAEIFRLAMLPGRVGGHLARAPLRRRSLTVSAPPRPAPALPVSWRTECRARWDLGPCLTEIVGRHPVIVS